jgi:hypothetical protein
MRRETSAVGGFHAPDRASSLALSAHVGLFVGFLNF